ncbi:MAG: TusE/DsrC/DsvC family sulfur relay protein [Gammaproteobacteria bacterium]|nr:TusE/DsrC/DsvC family sulfur relay protein [Gammaproteobacteria bacterium]
MYSILNNIFHTQFNNSGNTIDETVKLAFNSGIKLTDEHWNAIDFVKSVYSQSDFKEPSLRELRSSLKKHYKSQGGYRHLYELFPNGPINTINYLAGYTVQNGTYKGHGITQ